MQPSATFAGVALVKPGKKSSEDDFEMTENRDYLALVTSQLLEPSHDLDFQQGKGMTGRIAFQILAGGRFIATRG